jgi:hypothetical protein
VCKECLEPFDPDYRLVESMNKGACGHLLKNSDFDDCDFVDEDLGVNCVRCGSVDQGLFRDTEDNSKVKCRSVRYCDDALNDLAGDFGGSLENVLNWSQCRAGGCEEHYTNSQNEAYLNYCSIKNCV